MSSSALFWAQGHVTWCLHWRCHPPSLSPLTSGQFVWSPLILKEEFWALRQCQTYAIIPNLVNVHAIESNKMVSNRKNSEILAADSQKSSMNP